MKTFDLQKVSLHETRDPSDGTLLFKYAFPAYAAEGSTDCAVVYMEIEPGQSLGMHKDSEEEIVLVLEGSAEGTVGDEVGKLGTGAAVVIPAQVPHDFRNVGEGILRAIGFFSGATVISTFEPAPVPGADALVFFHDRHGEKAMLASGMA